MKKITIIIENEASTLTYALSPQDKTYSIAQTAETGETSDIESGVVSDPSELASQIKMLIQASFMGPVKNVG